MNEELYNHGIVGAALPPNPPIEWIRNSEWLAMPSVDSTENKIVILFRIDPGSSTFIGFSATVTGGYTVDWGDGTSGNFATTLIASKQYDFDAVSATTTSEGYKQVLITITPTSGGNTFTAIGFANKSTFVGTGAYRQGHQDLIISAPALTSVAALGTSGTNTLSYSYLERVQLLSSALTSYANLFGDLVALQSVSVTSSATVTNMSYMFQNCVTLSGVPGNLPYSTCTTLSNMFAKCYNLRSLNIATITTAATSVSSMFANCASLQTTPALVFTAASVDTGGLFNTCSALLVVPNVSWDKASTLSSTFNACTSLTNIPALNIPLCTSMATTFTGCTALRSIGNITSSTLLTTMSSTFSGCTRLLALPLISDSSNVTTIASIALNCYNILTCPAYDTGKVTTMTSAFSGCASLATMPVLSYAKCTAAGSMFTNCTSLKKVGTMDFGTTTTGAITLTSAFQCNNASQSGIQEIGPILIPSTATSIVLGSIALNGRALKTISVDCTKVIAATGVATLFSGASSLNSVILTGLKYGGFTIAGSLSAPALVDLFTSLGTASGAQTLTVSGNWGWANLTVADKLIATVKGWTLA